MPTRRYIKEVKLPPKAKYISQYNLV
jgi:hypothetical protein